MSILQNLSQSKQKLVNVGALISTIAFVAIVVVVLFKAFSIALFESENTSASTLPVIKDEQLKKAIDIVEKWNDYKKAAPRSSSPSAELELLELQE